MKKTSLNPGGKEKKFLWDGSKVCSKGEDINVMEGLPWLRVMGGGGKRISENREQNGKSVGWWKHWAILGLLGRLS